MVKAHYYLTSQRSVATRLHTRDNYRREYYTAARVLPYDLRAKRVNQGDYWELRIIARKNKREMAAADLEV